MSTISDQIQYPSHFFIDGQWVRPSSDATLDVISPSTEELFIRVAAAGEQDVDRAVAAARRAFDEGPWPRLSHTDRARYLTAFADKITERNEQLASLWTGEIGITRTLARALVESVAETYRHTAALAGSFAFEEFRPPLWGANHALLVREPVGVVGAIVAWNGALPLIAFKTAPALLAGCTVVVKSSPEAPTAGLVMAEIAAEIGLPPGVLNVITADREASERLVRHPDVDKISFTGSNAAGRRIGSICGERVARCTLELGGKSAAIILEDADLGDAAEQLSASTRMVTGQVCGALTRVIVSERRHDDLIDALKASFARILVGDPWHEETDMGPLAMRRQRDRVEEYIRIGKAEGAMLASGGARPSHLDRGFFIEPTIFANVENSMAIAQEEIFGPVISVIPCRDEVDAVRIANDSIFGLNSAVFTRDNTLAYRIGRQLRCGTVGHNAMRMDLSIGFGGFKQSGIGREGGIEGLMPFLESKTMLLDGPPIAKCD